MQKIYHLSQSTSTIFRDKSLTITHIDVRTSSLDPPPKKIWFPFVKRFLEITAGQRNLHLHIRPHTSLCAAKPFDLCPVVHTFLKPRILPPADGAMESSVLPSVFGGQFLVSLWNSRKKPACFWRDALGERKLGCPEKKCDLVDFSSGISILIHLNPSVYICCEKNQMLFWWWTHQQSNQRHHNSKYTVNFPLSKKKGCKAGKLPTSISNLFDLVVY